MVTDDPRSVLCYHWSESPAVALLNFFKRPLEEGLGILTQGEVPSDTAQSACIND